VTKTKTKTVPTGYEVVYSDGYTVLVKGVDIPFDAIVEANEATGREANPSAWLVAGADAAPARFDLVVVV
jgi:hypothetical protein